MTAPRPLELRLFGPFQASAEGVPIEFPTRHCGFVLAVLALSEGAHASRERLANLLWGTRGESQARASLRQTLYNLQRELGEAGVAQLAVSKDAVALRPRAWRADVADLPKDDPLAAARRLSGGLLDGRGRVDPVFEEWIGSQESALRLATVARIRTALTAHAASGDEAAVEMGARAILSLEPYDEAALRSLMSSLAALGRRHEAQLVFQKFCAELAEELQAEPDAETDRLAAEIAATPGVAPSQDPTPEAQDAAQPAETADAHRERHGISLVLALPASVDPRDPETSQTALATLTAAAEPVCAAVGARIIDSYAAGLAAVIGLDQSEQHQIDALSLGLGIAKQADARVSVVAGTALIRQTVDLVEHDLATLSPLLTEATVLADATAPRRVRTTPQVADVAQGWFAFEDDTANGSPLVLQARARTRWQAWSDRRLSPLAGRDTELAVLRAALANASKGSGQVIDVIGEAGIGKTRLLHELLRAVADVEIGVLHVEAAPADRSRPFAPLIRMVRERSHQDGAAAILDRLERILGKGESPETELDPADRRRALQALLMDVVAGIVADRPLLLLVEDLHWLDDETRYVLERLADDLPGMPVLLIVTHRPTLVTGWTGRSYATALRLSPLDHATAVDLARGLVGTSAKDEERADRIATQTGGNPLFIEEMARETTATTSPVGGEGHLPSSVENLLASSIAALPPDARQLIATAAALGIELPETRLRTLLERPDPEFDAALRPVLAAELMHRMRVHHDQPLLRFRHALVQEAAYGFLLRSARRRLHARIVSLLEAEPGTERLELAPTLAHHARLAEDWPRAFRWAREAGDRFAEITAYRDARQAYEQALDAADRSAEIGPRDELDLRLRLRPVLVPLGAFDQTVEHLDAAEALLGAIGDPALSAAVHISRSYLLSTHGRLPQAAASARRAADAVRGSGQLAHEAALALGQAETLAGRWQETLDALAPGEGFWARHPRERFGHTGTRSVWYHGHLSHAYLVSGAIEPARRHAATAQEIAAETRRPLDRIFADHRAGAIALASGDAGAALSLLEPAMERARDCDAPIFQTWFACDLAPALAAVGRLEDAAALLETQDRTARRLSLLQFGAWVRLRQGELALLRGNKDTAQARVDMIAADLAEIGDRILEVATLRLASRCQGDPGLLEQARERAESWGLAQEIAACQRP